MNVTNSTTIKTIGALAAGLAGWMTVGSYGASKPQWTVEANAADQKAILNAQIYEKTIQNTGNIFIPPILNYFNRPEFAFQHKFRRAFIFAKGFTRDVVWENILPMGLGALALIWGFNLKATKALSYASNGAFFGIKTGAKVVSNVVSSIKAVLPKIDTWKAVSGVFPKTPKGVLTLAAAAAIGLFMLPYAIFEAATGRAGKDMSDKYFNRY